MALTNALLKSKLSIQHDKRFVDLSDGNGLVARWFKTGKISWYLRYRWQGKPVAFQIGSYPIVTIKEARAKAMNCRAMIDEGIDPRVEKKTRIDQHVEEQEMTLTRAIEYWFDNELPRRRKDTRMVERPIKRDILPVIGDVPVSDLTPQHWMKAFKNMASAPVLAGDTLGNLKQALRYCRVTGFCETSSLDLLSVKDIGKVANKRDRVLSRQELRDLWDYCNDLENTGHLQMKYFLAIVMTTGCRSGEVRQAHKSDFNLDTMKWVVPKERSKTGVEIQRPIPPRLKPVLVELFNLAGPGTFLLPSPRKKDSCISTRLVTLGVENIVTALGHPKWTAHSLRHTLSTTFGDLEIEPYIAEKLLGHQMAGVMAVYNKSHYLKQQAEALETWLDYVSTDREFDDYI